ncbi:Small nuclear ribonucleoprotein E like protein [Aduncisulcus paluster]|uniref:Sm protein E n=1 Tax=Aduncisulcus paluster TaxID=2918883 RepID=A0ABQ5KVX1_9EUKA|nr:Small nuclear ribonucleoprotein E like protein [Aduncisulcus paluster]
MSRNVPSFVYDLVKKGGRVSVWLFENTRTRMEGRLVAFDPYMNLTLVNCDEVEIKSGKRKHLGEILLKGDNVTAIQDLKE